MLGCGPSTEARILSRDADELPTPAELERLVSSLERKGNLRLVICAVEEWSREGDPTLPAQLAQIRALTDLCAVDRAWARLSPLLEDTEDLETFQVAATLLVEQGRITEARTVLGRGRELHRKDPILKQLWARTDGSGTQVDLTEPNEEDVEARVRHAERLLREGSPLKARRLLERLQVDFPTHQRVTDLLWASDGEFQLKGVTLHDLVQVHAPALLPAGTDDEPEHTEAGRSDIVAALLDDETTNSFPSLFKGMRSEQPITYPKVHVEQEVTMASFAEDPDELPTAFTDGDGEEQREDTQIMHVVRNDGDPSDVDTLIDRAPPQRADVPSGESEDEHVVLRRKPTSGPQIANRDIEDTDDGPVRLDPSRERVQEGASAADEGSDFVTKPIPRVDSEEETPKQVTRTDLPNTPVPSTAASPQSLHEVPTLVLEEPAFPEEEGGLGNFVTWTGWLLILVIFGLLIIGAGGLLILLQAAALL